MSKELTTLFKKVLFQKGQKELTSTPFYIDGNQVAITAFANGTGLPPGARIKFQELVYIDGGRTDGTLCVPGKMSGSILCDCKPLMSCGCEPTLTERNNYIVLDRPGWFRAVYEGPSRQSVMVVARELVGAAGTGCCVSACCPIEVDLSITKTITSQVVPVGTAAAFTLTVENKGPEASKGGSIKDALPAGLVSYTAPSAVFSGGAIGAPPTLTNLSEGTWHYTLLPVGGKIVITVPFTATTASPVPQVNLATVEPGTGEVDTDWGNNRATVLFVVGIPAAPQLPVLDEGNVVVTAPAAINFEGAGVTATVVAGVATITIPGSLPPTPPLAILDEGVIVVAASTALNFTGNGVKVTNVAGVPTVFVRGFEYYSDALGATGDGVTDDVVLVQAVLDIVGAAGGGVVLCVVPHAISKSLEVWSNTRLLGTSMIRPTAGFIGTLGANNCYLIRNKNWAAAAILDENIHVEGLRFDYGALVLPGGGLHAVSMRRVRNTSVRDSAFNGGENATAFLGCTGTLVDNCDATNFINCAYDHWTSPSNAVVQNSRATSSNSAQMVNFNPENTTGSSVGNQATGFKMLNNTLTYHGASACPVQIEPLSAGSGVSDVVVSGNTFNNSYLVSRGLVGRMRVKGNAFLDIRGGRPAMYVEQQFGVRPYYVTVTGNTANGVAATAGGTGAFTVAANQFTVTGNQIDCPASLYALYCFPGVGIESGNMLTVGTSGFAKAGV